jgi:hypothetical protein
MFFILKFIFLAKFLDFISTNSDNTLDKTILLNFNLFSTNKNNTLIIDYGDSTQQTFSLNSCYNLFLFLYFC